MKFKVYLCFIVLSFSLYGCLGGGGGGDSGGADKSNTIQLLPPQLNTTNITSDVAKWSDVNGDGKVCDFVNDSYSVLPDTVIVTVTSKVLPGIPSGIQPSSVRLDSAEIRYNPADNFTPVIPPQYYSLGITVNPDMSVSFPLEIVSQSLKTSFLPRLLCTDTIYTYYVTIEISAVEINTGKRMNIQSTATLKIGDFSEIGG